jgi:transposase
MTGISVRSANETLLRFRGKTAREYDKRSPFAGELEPGECYFGPRPVCGRRRRSVGRKTIVFGLLKRGDRFYTEIVPNAFRAALQAMIRMYLNKTGFRFNH